jgi:hypothetical protein
MIIDKSNGRLVDIKAFTKEIFLMKATKKLIQSWKTTQRRVIVLIFLKFELIFILNSTL